MFDVNFLASLLTYDIIDQFKELDRSFFDIIENCWQEAKKEIGWEPPEISWGFILTLVNMGFKADFLFGIKWTSIAYASTDEKIYIEFRKAFVFLYKLASILLIPAPIVIISSLQGFTPPKAVKDLFFFKVASFMISESEKSEVYDFLVRVLGK
jgi:hypothetical protein